MISKNFRGSFLVFICFACFSLACSVFQRGVDALLVTPEITTAPETGAAPEETLLAESPPEVAQPETGDTTYPLVAYIKDGNLWVWHEDAGSMALTSSGKIIDVQLSDDGLVAAFTRQVDDWNVDLWVVNTDGTGKRMLASIEALNAMVGERKDPNASAIAPFQFDWQPASHKLTFNTRPVFLGPGLVGYDDLVVVDTDTLQTTLQLPPGQGGNFAYSPDGQQIAIITPDKIQLMTAEGKDARLVLEYARVSTYSEYLYYATPVWAGDSSYLRVAIPPAEAMAEPRQPTTVWHIPLEGAVQQLASLETAPFFMSAFTFSPDLQQILYVRQVGALEQNDYELHLAALDGSKAIILQQNNVIQLAGWAGDAEHYMFTFVDQTTRAMQLGNIDGTSIPFTANPVDVGEVRWLDEQRYVYTRLLDGTWELRIGNLNGDSLLVDSLASDFPRFDFK